MSKKIIKALKHSSWFQSLPDEVLKDLATKVISYELDKDEVLIRKNDKGDSVFYIYDGWVKIVAGDALGGEVVLNHLGPGEFVGELSLVDQKPRSASVVALSSIHALELKRDDFINILYENPEIALHIIANISSRMRFTSTYVEKAIQWSYRIASGDYDFATDEIQKTNIIDTSKPDDVRANRFLDAFFRMLEGIKSREDALKTQLVQLTIEIDQAKRDEEIDSVINSEIFQKIKAESTQLRGNRVKK
ncbi:MAG: cyclic nucleotide-binding domain-containing protein [Chloroflexi bacterium]|nr:cyclic nucleotide-binding domain-containing protein [Chloroflexota bacterium]